MALTPLRNAAARAAVPVFVVAGSGQRAGVEQLHLDRRIRVVDSPRHAVVLLVVGTIHAELREPLERLHDALPGPRTTLWWARSSVPPPIPAAVVEDGADVVEACVRRGRDVIAAREPGESPLLPDVELNPWRGVGPYGQGGTGMTGGTPYGRPLAGRADDLRDRLTLDVVPVTVGPFFTPLPEGLVLRVTLQGDIVQDLEVVRRPDPPERHDDLFWVAAAQQLPLRDLELARAAAHLRWLAGGLRLLGLHGLAHRALRLSLAPDPQGVRRLSAIVSKVVAPVTRGVAPLPLELVQNRGLGTVARASGATEDARSDDPAYRSLGFEPVTQQRGDVWARWRQRLAETEQSLDLARRADDAMTGGDRRAVEGPRGVVGGDQLSPLIEGLPDWLRGSEWGDAVVAMASVDLSADLQPADPAAAA